MHKRILKDGREVEIKTVNQLSAGWFAVESHVATDDWRSDYSAPCGGGATEDEAVADLVKILES